LDVGRYPRQILAVLPAVVRFVVHFVNTYV